MALHLSETFRQMSAPVLPYPYFQVPRSPHSAFRTLPAFTTFATFATFSVQHTPRSPAFTTVPTFTTFSVPRVHHVQRTAHSPPSPNFPRSPHSTSLALPAFSSDRWGGWEPLPTCEIGIGTPSDRQNWNWATRPTREFGPPPHAIRYGPPSLLILEY
jgi:hypothetical protein